MLRPFELVEPTSVAEASAVLDRHGEAARLYAGGTELLLAMKEGLVHYDYLVNVKTIPGLAAIRRDGDGTLPDRRHRHPPDDRAGPAGPRALSGPCSDTVLDVAGTTANRV